MKKILVMLLSITIPVIASAQLSPPPGAAYTYNGTTWLAVVASGVQSGLPYAPPPIALYGYDTSTQTWVRCTTTGSCFGGSSVTAVAIQSALQPLTNCNTAGYTYSPFSGTCVLSGGTTLPANLTAVATDGSGNGVQATSAQISTLVNGGTAPLAYSVHTTNSSGVSQFLRSMTIGAPAITDTGVAAQFTNSVAGYYQWVMQNTSSAAGASTDIVLNNDLGTASAFYANLGINASGFTGAGALNLPSATYLTGTSGDLVLGTTTANALHFLSNNATTDAITISATNVPTLNSPALTGTPTAPTATAGDNSTKVATTNYADRAVANGPAAPPISNGLALWQRFTEAQGVAPVDYSGNGYVSTMPGGATNPTATAEGLVFSPLTSQYYTLPSAISALTTPTFMAVICQNNPTSTLGWSQPTFATSTSGSGLVLGLFGYGSIYSPNGETWAPSMGITTTDFTSNFIPRTASSATEGDCRVITWIPGAPDHIYVMEQEVAYGTPNGGGQNSSIAGAGIGSLQIGGGITNNHLTGGNFDGILRELFVYNRALTGNDLIRQVQNAKAIALQDGSPFVRTVSPVVTSTVVCDGDSITAGAGVSNSYCTSALFTPTETVTVQKVAIAGRSLLAGASSAYTDLAPLARPNAPHSTLLVYLGTNNSHESASQILAAYNKITVTGRQLGYKVVWAPMIARGNVDDANKDVVAPVLFANAPLMADGYLNWDTDPILGADAAALNATYFQGDHVHPTQVGQNLMGVYWTNVYNKLWGSTETTPITISTSTRTLGAADSWSIVTANSTLTLPSCYGYAGFWSVKVNPGLTVTIKTALSTQTIDGTDYSSSGLTLTAGVRTRFLVVPGAMTTGGCTWSQQ